MKKKYVVALIIVLIGWAAFFYFNSVKQKETRQAQSSLTASRIVEAAQKSPRAGMSQMASALNRYQDKHKRFPATLMDLYPKFITAKAFINDVNWHYQPRKTDFLLKKTIQDGDRLLTIAVNSTFDYQFSGGPVVMAKITPPTIAEPAPTPAAAKQPQTRQPLLLAKNTPEDKTAPAPTDAQDTVNILIDELPVDLPMETASMPTPKPLKKLAVKTIGRRIVSEIKGPIGSGITAQTASIYLVWRNRQGNLGFGNVDYPETQQLTLYKDGYWITIERSDANQADDAMLPEDGA